MVSPVSPAAGTGTLVPSSPVSPSPSPISSTLPPGPPLDWKTLPIDTKTIYGIRLEGPFILPWTKSKAFIFNTVRIKYQKAHSSNEANTISISCWYCCYSSVSELHSGTNHKPKESSKLILYMGFVYHVGAGQQIP